MPASAPRRRTSPLPDIPTWCLVTESAWTLGAFSGEVKDGLARGAVDMEGGIACSVAAVLQYLADVSGKPKGSISFLITGMKEDISVNGTIKLLKWCAERGEKFDHCVLGEPSMFFEVLGDCDQDRPPRLADRRSHRLRRAGPHRLSRPRPQSAAGAGPAARPAGRPAARSRHPTLRALDAGDHQHRRQQPGRQRHPRPGGPGSTSASTTPTARSRCPTGSRKRPTLSPPSSASASPPASGSRARAS